ncbi:MAG: hypothetical protein QM765_43085 [Myxococcales bacterium]
MAIGRATEELFTTRIYSEFEGERVVVTPDASTEELVPIWMGQFGETPRYWCTRFRKR